MGQAYHAMGINGPPTYVCGGRANTFGPRRVSRRNTFKFTNAKGVAHYEGSVDRMAGNT